MTDDDGLHKKLVPHIPRLERVNPQRDREYSLEHRENEAG